MAIRRMFSIDVVNTDSFRELPHSAQLLYFYLGMGADDDGFITTAKGICRLHNIDEEMLKILHKNGYLLQVKKGVYLISHWKSNNFIRQDRYRKSIYQKLLDKLVFDEDTLTYSIPETMVTAVSSENERRYTQDRKGKDRIGKDKEREDGKKGFHGIYKNVFLTDNEYERLKQEFSCDYNKMIDNLSEYMESTGKTYKNHYATIRRWIREDGMKNKTTEKWCSNNEPEPEELLGITEEKNE